VGGERRSELRLLRFLDGVFAAWGDSLTAGTGGTPYPTTLATLTSKTVYNGGVGGDTSTQIRTRMVADAGKRHLYTIIWAGRNNFTDPATVKADIAAMVATLTTSKYVVLSILNGTGEPTGSANYTTLTTLNSDLAMLYSGHYVDVRATLVAAYDPGTPQDVIDHVNDVPPSTLRSDPLHLNTAGYTLVANTVNTYISAHP
jgi:lysophospholipase L1-like esterase